MKLERWGKGAALAVFVVFILGCGGDTTVSPQTGVLSVKIIDISSNQPVAGVQVTIPGVNRVAETDSDGVATFKLPANARSW